MADVYKFKVTITDLPDKIWRDIELTSVSSVAKLGYTILAAFESTASHLFNIRFKGKLYEFVFDDDWIFEPAIDPSATKLSALKLTVGDTLTMEYDYGACWEFTIQLLDITEMKRGFGNHYPYVMAGQGKGMIEDIFPYELAEIIAETDRTGKLPRIYNCLFEEEQDWNYKDFDLKCCNTLLKGEIEQIQYAYEQY